MQVPAQLQFFLSTRNTPFENFRLMTEYNITTTQEYEQGIAALPKMEMADAAFDYALLNTPKENYDSVKQTTAKITGIAAYVFAGIYYYKGYSDTSLILAVVGTISLIVSRHFADLEYERAYQERIRPRPVPPANPNIAAKANLNDQLKKDREFIVGKIRQDLRTCSLYQMTIACYNGDRVKKGISSEGFSNAQDVAIRKFFEIRNELLRELKATNDADDEKGPGIEISVEGSRLQKIVPAVADNFKAYRPLVIKFLETAGIDSAVTKLRVDCAYFLGKRTPYAEGVGSYYHVNSLKLELLEPQLDNNYRAKNS